MRRKIISNLETIKVAVRTVPSVTELISDQKKMTDLQVFNSKEFVDSLFKKK